MRGLNSPKILTLVASESLVVLQKRTFVEYMKTIVDETKARGPRIMPTKLDFFQRVHSVQFFESVVCMYIDR